MERYINADTLRKEISRVRINGLGNKPPEWHDAMWQCLDAILQTPTADVRENVHGEWVLDHWIHEERTPTVHVAYAVFRCSICGDKYFERFKHCPNCSAIMKEAEFWKELLRED